MKIRKEICVAGIVQGVGFRPYVYRLATDRNLEGNISNTVSGVTIEVQGPLELVEEWIGYDDQGGVAARGWAVLAHDLAFVRSPLRRAS